MSPAEFSQAKENLKSLVQGLTEKFKVSIQDQEKAVTLSNEMSKILVFIDGQKPEAHEVNPDAFTKMLIQNILSLAIDVDSKLIILVQISKAFKNTSSPQSFAGIITSPAVLEAQKYLLGITEDISKLQSAINSAADEIFSDNDSDDEGTDTFSFKYFAPPLLKDQIEKRAQKILYTLATTLASDSSPQTRTQKIVAILKDLKLPQGTVAKLIQKIANDLNDDNQFVDKASLASIGSTFMRTPMNLLEKMLASNIGAFFNEKDKRMESKTDEFKQLLGLWQTNPLNKDFAEEVFSHIEMPHEFLDDLKKLLLKSLAQYPELSGVKEFREFLTAYTPNVESDMTIIDDITASADNGSPATSNNDNKFDTWSRRFSRSRTPSSASSPTDSVVTSASAHAPRSSFSFASIGRKGGAFITSVTNSPTTPTITVASPTEKLPALAPAPRDWLSDENLLMLFGFYKANKALKLGDIARDYSFMLEPLLVLKNPNYLTTPSDDTTESPDGLVKKVKNKNAYVFEVHFKGQHITLSVDEYKRMQTKTYAFAVLVSILKTLPTRISSASTFSPELYPLLKVLLDM